MQPIIKVSNLVTRFGKLTIHDNLQLEIAPGEIIAIIGGSGSGKSTLLREMILLEKPAAGSIEILGQEILTLSDSQALWLRKVCGVMFQNGALFSSLTVAENIALPLREHTKLSTDFIQEIVALKLALVGLSVEVGAKYPSQISGGMNKRVAVARALALDPQILFLDEPTAGLDPISAAALDELILQLRQLLGLTIVIITHDLDTLWKVTDRVAVLADRKLIAAEPLNTLVNFDHPWLQEYFHGERGRNTLTE
jgi:phospholipid/cholesterol/gamma-HCH transport system ATP-binding protein